MKIKRKIVDEIVYYVNEAIAQMADKTLQDITPSQIMPVIRATSFDKKTKKVYLLYMKNILQKQLFIMQ